MGKAVTRSGFSSWVYSAKPSQHQAKDKYLRLKTGTGSQVSFLYFPTPAIPKGAIVTKATLTLYSRGASSGNRTLTLVRLNSSWTTYNLTWKKQPVTTGPNITKAIGALKERQAVEVDVTSHVQTIVNGGWNRGWRIATNSGTAHYFYGMSSAYKPVLTIEWSDAPKTPTRLNPAAGTVSVGKPTLQFDYTDLSGNTTLSAVHVQIDPNANGTTPAWDSGTVRVTAPELALTETSYPGLADGAATSWRVRVQDGAGLWSPWSSWATFTRAVKPVVTITEPTGHVVTETSPPIWWTLSAAQSAYQVIVYDDSLTRVLHDSGKRLGADDDYTLPNGVLIDNRTYTVEVRAWDTQLDRDATPGDPIYSSTSRTIHVEDDPSTPGPSSLTARAERESPFVTLDFKRASPPDSWAIYRDGVQIAYIIEPQEVFVSDTSYRYIDWTAHPNREHVYEVRAVVNGKQSTTAGQRVSVTPKPSGLWLVDPDREIAVTLWGDDEGTWTSEDDAAVYTPVGSSKPVRIVSAMRGLSGSLTGSLMEGFGRSFDELEADLYALKESPSETYRLIAGDVNLPVLVGNIRISPTPRTRAGRLVKNVAFDFWQNGELPFTARL